MSKKYLFSFPVLLCAFLLRAPISMAQMMKPRAVNPSGITPAKSDALTEGGISGASVEVRAVIKDNNSPVYYFRATLKNAATGTVADTAYSGNTNRVKFSNVPTPVERETLPGIPVEYYVKQNFPNPFNPTTTIEYGIPKEGHASLKIYSVEGKLVKTLADGDFASGNYKAVWAGDNQEGQSVAAGVYFYVLEGQNFSVAKKMINFGGSGVSNNFRIGNYSPLILDGNNSAKNNNSLSKSTSLDYIIEISGSDSTRPNILTKQIPLTVSNDTTFEAQLTRYLKPATLSPISNITMPEDGAPQDKRLIDIWQNGVEGYDSLGNVVADSLLAYNLMQSNPSLVNCVIEGNRYIRLDSLSDRGNGKSTITLKVTGPNNQSAQKSFDITVTPMTDIEGRVGSLFTDSLDAISGVNVKYGNKTTTTDGAGRYHLKITPSTSLDTLVFSRDGYHERRPKRFKADRDTVINETMADTLGLPLRFLDITSRSRDPLGTQRWTSQPVWYININPPAGGGTITQAMIDTAVSIITHDIPKFTNNYFQNSQIIIGTNPPAYGSNDTIRVEWDNTIPGLGAHGEYVDYSTNRIKSAYAKMKTLTAFSTYRQELLQILGPRMDYPYNDLQTIFGTTSFITHLDNNLGKFIYSRLPKNLSPDKD